MDIKEQETKKTTFLHNRTHTPNNGSFLHVPCDQHRDQPLLFD